MKFLITGSNGYVGEYLSRLLKKANELIITATRKDFDFKSISQIREFFKEKEITHVIHLAASISNENSKELFDINITGLYNLLKVCQENHIQHFTFASSNNVYGTYKDNRYTEEDNIYTDSSNYYGMSKYTGELLVSDFCKKNNIVFANVRIGDIYGPYQNHGNLLKTIVRNVKEEKDLIQYGQGIRERDYIYIEDVVEGLYFISKYSLSGVINLSTGVGTTIRQLLNISKAIVDNKIKIIYKEVENEDTTKVVLDNVKLQKLGFSPKVSIEEGIKKVFEEEIFNKK